MEIRELRTLEDFQRCVEIQKEVWGFDDPYDVVPLPLLVVSERIDGIVLGAYDAGRMIGFVYSLPGYHSDQKIQWSHMLAVIPSYRNSDIGYQLKTAQYGVAQKKGYDVVEWTYDPLESRNAYFNLRKLGCIAKEYELNIYGDTSSPLHSGSPTDRLIAHWPIPPLAKVHPDWNEPPELQDTITITERAGDALLIKDVNLRATGEFLFLEIPSDMQTLKAQYPEAGLEWRLKTRDAFSNYLRSGYVVYTFLSLRNLTPPRSFYVLRANPG